MKKILLGLFILSSLSFAELPDALLKTTVPVNVKATIRGNLSLEITDEANTTITALNYDHGLLPNNTTGNVATKTFQVHLSDGTNKQLITDNSLLTIPQLDPLIISNGSNTIETRFSQATMEGSTGTYTMTNTLPGIVNNIAYESGEYTGNTNLTITYNKTSSRP